MGKRASIHPQSCVLPRSLPLRRWRIKSGQKRCPPNKPSITCRVQLTKRHSAAVLTDEHHTTHEREADPAYNSRANGSANPRFLDQQSKPKRQPSRPSHRAFGFGNRRGNITPKRPSATQRILPCNPCKHCVTADISRPDTECSRAACER
jgi:hypothetical protein